MFVIPEAVLQGLFQRKLHCPGLLKPDVNCPGHPTDQFLHYGFFDKNVHFIQVGFKVQPRSTASGLPRLFVLSEEPVVEIFRQVSPLPGIMSDAFVSCKADIVAHLL